jgi:transaldolase
MSTPKGNLRFEETITLRTGQAMKPTARMHEAGQRLWLDNITRDLLRTGTLKKYIDDFSVTGLTSNPTIFDQAFGGGDSYDDSIRNLAAAGKSPETLFTEIALEDLCEAADLFLPIHQASQGMDGWVSMEISPLLAQDAQASLEAAREIHALADRPNLFVKIPGTPASLPAIEAAIHAGIPVNITLLFSCAQYQAAAEAYLRGIEKRLEQGLDAKVACVASVFVSRWDTAVREQVSPELRNQLGLAVCRQVYAHSLALHQQQRWVKLAARGAHPQRLLWASTGTKDPQLPQTWYADALVAPGTINTLPEKTLWALADAGRFDKVMDTKSGNDQKLLNEFARQGIDRVHLAEQLQHEGEAAFIKSWNQLMERLDAKCRTLSG